MSNQEQNWQALSSTFFQFGPFFAALFVQIWMVYQARRWYLEVCTRVPPSTPREQARYEYYFLGTIILSATFFAVAVSAWWQSNITTDFHYNVEIENLKANEVVQAPQYYTTTANYPGPVVAVHSTSFLITDTRPFHNGRHFQVGYELIPQQSPQTDACNQISKGSTLVDLNFEYTGNPQDHFRIGSVNGQPKLERVDEASRIGPAPVHFAFFNSSPVRVTNR